LQGGGLLTIASWRAAPAANSEGTQSS